MTDSELKLIVANVLGVESGGLSESSSPDQIDGWDSIKTMNIVFAIEDASGVEFTDEQIASMLNYGLIRLAFEEASGERLAP